MSRKFTLGRKKGNKEKAKLGETSSTSLADNLVGVLTKDQRSSVPSKPIGYPLFGSPISEVMKKQKKMAGYGDYKVPIFIKLALEYIVRNGIAMEGIFRVSGKLEGVNRLYEEVRDSTIVPNLEGRHDLNAHIVSSLFKQYLRELPEPLLTYALGKQFMALDAGDKNCVRDYQQMVRSLPTYNRNLLASIMHLLHAIADNEEINKMSLDNLARVIGPNCYWDPSGEVSLQGMLQLNQVLHFMVEHSWEIFEEPVSSFALTTTPAIMFRRKLPGHVKSVQCMALDDGHDVLWSVDSSGYCRVHHTQTLDFVLSVETGYPYIFDIVASQDQVWIGSQQSIQIRNSVSGEVVRELAWFGYCFTRVGDMIWNGGDEKIRVWDRRTFQCLHEITVSPGVMIFALVQHDDRVFVACSDQMIRVYHAISLSFIHEFSAHSRKVNRLLVIPATSTLWTCSDDMTINIYDATSYTLLHTISEHQGKVFDLCSFGTEVWSCSWDKKICIWDSKTYKMKGTLPNYHEDAVSQVIPCYNRGLGKWQAWSGSWDKSLTVWDLPKCDLPVPGSAPDTDVLSIDVPPLPARSPRSAPSIAPIAAADDAVIWIALENAIAIIEDGRIITPAMQWSDAFAVAPLAKDTLENCLQHHIDVRIWTPMGPPQVVYWKMLWIEKRLGAHWVERLVVSKDMDIIHFGPNTRFIGPNWPCSIPLENYILIETAPDMITSSPSCTKMASWGETKVLFSD